jgi:hypothetical protein
MDLGRSSITLLQAKAIHKLSAEEDVWYKNLVYKE